MRHNLAVDPSLRSETTVAYVGLEGSTLSYNTDYSFYGRGALKVAKTNVNGAGVQIARAIPVIATLQYAFAWYIRLPIELPRAEDAEVLMEIQWLNSFGVVVATDQSAALRMDDDSVWYRIGGVWTAPAVATFVRVRLIQPIPGGVGEAFLVDALLIEQADYVGGYFDNITRTEKMAIAHEALAASPQVINGLRLAADVSINNHILNTIDENDTIWVCTGLEGWWGQTAPELPNIPRGTEEGSYDVEGRLTARSVTLSGFFIPKDNKESLSESINRLVTAISLVRQGGWLVAYEYPTKAAWVRLAGRPTVTTVNAKGRTEFTIPLRAGDPIKYHWNDEDAEGYTNLVFEAADLIGTAENIGTAQVAGNFVITGPAGAGTRVTNATTGETMTLQYPLRGAGAVADAYQVEALNGIATIYTTEANGLRIGDEVALLNMVIPFSESDQTRIVTHVSEVFPFSFSFAIGTDDIDLLSTSGQILLVNNDQLEIDTYNRSVRYNGEVAGHRNRLTTLTDWIHFGPGENLIEFFDEVSRIEVISKSINSNEVTLTTDTPHYFISGEDIEVALPETVALAKKSLTANEVTLTTAEPHGFAVGDKIDVESTETSKVVNKSLTANVASLTTAEPHGVAASDQIVVNLPTTMSPVQKSLSSNVAMLTSQNAHGLSAGDQVTVALPELVTISNKQLTGNQVTITTTTPHNYTVGDTINVIMPSGVTVTKKSRSGSLIVITTSAPHGYSVSDAVIVSLPTTATLTGTRSFDATTNLVTLNTTTAHNFSVGDRIIVSLNNVDTRTISNRSATTTECTITTSGSHLFSVGEQITVAGVSARYNGTFYISAVTSSTITYVKSGTAEASVASSGTVVSNTIQSYNATKIIETIPSATSFTFRDWTRSVSTTSGSTSGTIANTTNQSYNGTKTIVSSSGTTFAYNA